MSSYVNKKTRVFQDGGDAPEVVRKRSEGRMKSYPSATDARAWCIINEDRRQHILELIRVGGGKVHVFLFVAWHFGNFTTYFRV